MSRPPTATIWVGNLPFDTTEDEVYKLLKDVGPIKNFRLIIDRETGKPKGFGFCEFHSKEVAESAYRNLNNTMFNGRQIRIDFAEENMSERGFKGGYKERDRGDRDGGRPDRDVMGAGPPRGHHPPIGLAAAQQSAAQVRGLLGGTASTDGRTQDMLNDLLASKSRGELWEVMRMLKESLGGDRAKAKDFFANRPGLAKAVFQAQVLLGMVKAVERQQPPPPGFGPPPPGFPEGPISMGPRPMAAAGPPPPPPRPAAGGPLGLQPLPPGAVPPPQGPLTQIVVVDPATGQQQTVMVPAGQLPTMQGPPGQPGIIPAGGPVSLQQPDGLIALQPQQQPMQPVPMAAAPPPVQQQQQQQPVVQPPQPPPAAGVPPANDPQMQTLLRQVAGMTDEHIASLPDAVRAQVLYVKNLIQTQQVQLQ